MSPAALRDETWDTWTCPFGFPAQGAVVIIIIIKYLRIVTDIKVSKEKLRPQRHVALHLNNLAFLGNSTSKVL